MYFQYDDVHSKHLSLLANYAGRGSAVPHYFCHKNCLEIKSTVTRTHEMETGSVLMVCIVVLSTVFFFAEVKKPLKLEKIQFGSWPRPKLF